MEGFQDVSRGNISYTNLSSITYTCITPGFLSKKHLNFGQGLEFLKFGQGNRGPNQQNRRKTQEKIRKNEENRRKFDKKFRDRDPYFLFKNFFLKLFSVIQTAACTVHTKTARCTESQLIPSHIAVV